MTPEERADQLYFELSIILPPLPEEWSTVAVHEACTAMIRLAIRAAVEAEREACALMCDEWGQGDCDASISALDFEKKYGDQIDLPAYIRARKDTP